MNSTELFYMSCNIWATDLLWLADFYHFFLALSISLCLNAIWSASVEQQNGFTWSIYGNAARQKGFALKKTMANKSVHTEHTLKYANYYFANVWTLFWQNSEKLLLILFLPCPWYPISLFPCIYNSPLLPRPSTCYQSQ